jgi:hypothetical protein
VGAPEHTRRPSYVLLVPEFSTQIQNNMNTIESPLPNGASEEELLEGARFIPNEPSANVAAVAAGTVPNGSKNTETFANYDPYSAINFAEQDEAGGVSTEEENISVGRPGAEDFFRASPDPNHVMMTTLLVVTREDGYGKAYFLLVPAMAKWARAQVSLKKFVKQVKLYLTVNGDGEYGLWPVRNSLDAWAVSENQVALTAMASWTRIYASGKVFKAQTAVGDERVPEFPNQSLRDLLRLAFGDAFLITSQEHPVIKKLLGIKDGSHE